MKTMREKYHFRSKLYLALNNNVGSSLRLDAEISLCFNFEHHFLVVSFVLFVSSHCETTITLPPIYFTFPQQKFHFCFDVISYPPIFVRICGEIKTIRRRAERLNVCHICLYLFLLINGMGMKLMCDTHLPPMN